MLHPSLYIAETKDRGRGVFTRKKISAEIVVEISPVIVMNAADRIMLDKTLLHDYIFEWGENKDQCAMAMGYVAVYNHSHASNCEYFMLFDEDKIIIKTVRKIKAGEELTINYNGDWNNEEAVWFDLKTGE